MLVVLHQFTLYEYHYYLKNKAGQKITIKWMAPWLGVIMRLAVHMHWTGISYAFPMRTATFKLNVAKSSREYSVTVLLFGA